MASGWKYSSAKTKSSTAGKKGEVEKKRVRDVRGEYDSLAKLLGLCQKRLNKTAILEAAVNFIQRHHDGLDIPMMLPNSPPTPPKKKRNLQHQSKKRQQHVFDPSPCSNVVEVVISCSPDSVASATPASTPSTSSKSADSYLLCHEEMEYLDESDEEGEEIKQLEIASSHNCQSSQPHHQPVDNFQSPAQLYETVPPSEPLVYSPKSPWLTTSSPQFAANVLTTNFSPPMSRQTTAPLLHHLSPPISSPVASSFYEGPCIAAMSNYGDNIPTPPPGLMAMPIYDDECEIN